MIKLKVNYAQDADNAMSINADNACCPDNTPAADDYTATADDSTIADVTGMKIQRTVGGTEVLLPLTGLLAAGNDQANRKIIVAAIEAAGYNVTAKGDVVVTDSKVDIKNSEMIPHSLVMAATEDDFSTS